MIKLTQMLKEVFMDQIKTGQFIKAVRKERSMTQQELADKLYISEKTVSKWETGKGMPDVSLMLPLCKILDISVNELLSGQKLDENDYKVKAEENIINLAKDKTKPKTKITICTVSCIIILFAAFAMIFIAAYAKLDVWLRILLISSAFAAVIANIAVIVLVAVNTEIYECSKCGEKFVPTLSSYVLAPHTLTRRYLKCPHCKRKSWNKSKLK